MKSLSKCQLDGCENLTVNKFCCADHYHKSTMKVKNNKMDIGLAFLTGFNKKTEKVLKKHENGKYTFQIEEKNAKTESIRPEPDNRRKKRVLQKVKNKTRLSEQDHKRACKTRSKESKRTRKSDWVESFTQRHRLGV